MRIDPLSVTAVLLVLMLVAVTGLTLGHRLCRRYKKTGEPVSSLVCDQCSARAIGLDRPAALAWAQEHVAQHHPDPTPAAGSGGGGGADGHPPLPVPAPSPGPHRGVRGQVLMRLVIGFFVPKQHPQARRAWPLACGRRQRGRGSTPREEVTR
jgi:hypothetical protein